VLPLCGGNYSVCIRFVTPHHTFHPLHDQRGLSHCQRQFGMTGTTLE